MHREASAHAPATESLMARLKAETKQLHERIEQVVPLMRADLDRPSYHGYLARLLGYLRPLEESLAAFAPEWARWGVDFEARRKSALVARDLVSLGTADRELAALPECPELPRARTLEEAWGSLYVLEGSTLGGQVILRTLGPRLGLSLDEGLAFLGGYGERTGASWKAFTGAVARFDEAGCDRGAVVRGARETFVTQMAWLGAMERGGG